MTAIEHVFVLMMENRSFDHFFGLSGLPGVPRPPATEFRGAAPNQMLHDPAHDYEAVQKQLAGCEMTGFATHDPKSMLGFEPGQIPVVMALAREYLLMDNWFSSMPGPTWPNRFFAHAASSGGLDNNPGWDDYGSIVVPSLHFRFERGHIFDRLLDAGRTWRVYHGADWPQVLSLEGMVSTYANDRGNVFRPNKQLAEDLALGDAATYTWIEPTHSAETLFMLGDSQHPRGSVRAGERLIQDIYNAIRQSPLWDRSLLLITWDEHGGFYDHVKPAKCAPPGDAAWNRQRAGNPRDCGFDTLGPRVPALLISPLLPRGLGSKLFPNQAFDHSSIIASLRAHFGLGPALTQRDENAPTWNSALLPAVRAVTTESLQLSVPADMEAAALDGAAGEDQPEANLAGFALIARSVDHEIAKMKGQPPVAAMQRGAMEMTSRVLAPSASGAETTQPGVATAHREVLAYMAAVRARESDFRAEQK